MKPHSIFHRLTAGLVLFAYGSGLTAPVLMAQDPSLKPLLTQDGWVPPPPIKSKSARPNLGRQVKAPDFKKAKLDNPSVDELNASRALKTPLRTLSGKTVSRKDKEDLALQMKKFVEDNSASQSERLKHLTRYLAEHPNTGVAASLHEEVALAAAASGDFVLATSSYKTAWQALKAEKNQTDLITQAEIALGNLAMLYARTGQKQALEALLKEVKERPAHPYSAQMLHEAREFWERWDKEPLANLSCGIAAYNFVAEQAGLPSLSKYGAAIGQTEAEAYAEVNADFDLLVKGLSAANLLERISGVGAEFKLIKRVSGTTIPVPSIVHLKFDEQTGHYSALLSGSETESLLKDPHLRFDGLMENVVLNKMASGFFLVKADLALPEGFIVATQDEAAEVSGRASCPGGAGSEGSDGSCPSGGCGMPTYGFSNFQGGLIFSDTPLTYQPTFGPKINFSLSYRELAKDYEDITSETSNFGLGWTHGLQSYITTETLSRLPATTTLKWKQSDGSYFLYDWNGSAFVSRLASRPQLSLLPNNQGYRLTFSDDSTMDFTQANGSVITRFYLSKITDAQGLSLTLAYDSLLRLASITDATGKISTFEYVSTSYRIHKIIDPYSREAVFTYNGQGKLETVTDTLGLTSSFVYSGNKMAEMTTPYGTHRFRDEYMTFNHPAQGQIWGVATVTARVATDPQGDEQRSGFIYHDAKMGATALEVRPPTTITVGATAVPFFPTVLNDDHFNVTLNWTKKYWREYLKAKAAFPNTDPFDYAEATLWLTGASGQSVPVPHAHKLPGLAMEWYNYPGQTAGLAYRPGTDDSPTKAARQTEDSTGATVWVLKEMTYNALGLPLTSEDEMGRITATTYAANNIDVTSVRVTSAAGGIVKLYSNYTRHLPGTVTEANGVITTYIRNAKDQETEVIVNKGGTAERTRYTYDLDGLGVPDGQPGYLMKIEKTNPALSSHPSAGSGNASNWVTTATFTYDTHGRMASQTDETGYTVTYDYDVFDRLTLKTYPDGTTEQHAYTLLDLSATKDRAGRWSRSIYNSLRQPVIQISWDGKTTKLDWCRCGKLYKLTDPANRVTQWKLDALGRPTEKLMPDGVTKTTYTYQPRSGRLATMKRPNEQALSTPTVTYSYDLNGALKKEDYTATTTPDVTYTYEATAPGRISTIVDGIGSTTITYGTFLTTTPTSAAANNIGQVNLINGPMTDGDFTMIYDWQGRRVGSTLSGSIGRTETAVLDVLGRVKSISSPVAGTFDYTYSDLSSRPASLSYGSLLTTSFSYFPNSATGARAQRLQSITHTTPGQTPAIAASHVYDYDIAGRLTSWQKAGRGLTAVNESYGYNLSDELTRHETKNASTQATLDQSGWSYDLAGNWLSAGSPSNMTARTHNVMNRLTSTGGAGHTMVEGNVNEFADVKVNNNSVPLVADAANGGYRFRAKVPVTAGSNSVTIKATDPANEETNQTWQFTAAATGKTYTYDLNGNMLSDGTRTFTWDAKDRLKKIVVAGAATEWDYDYLDRRVREYQYPSTSAKPTIPTKQYLWDGQQIVRERNGTSLIAGTVTRTHYTHSFVDHLLNNTSTLLPLKDHLGNVREVLGNNNWYFDISFNPAIPVGGANYTGNQIVERWDYSAYQKPTNVTATTTGGGLGPIVQVNASLLVIGRYQTHAASGLQLALYRGYDPDLGRWISEDPLEEEGGLNLYGYVENGPLGAVDPLGLCGPALAVPIGLGLGEVAVGTAAGSYLITAAAGIVVACTLTSSSKRGGWRCKCKYRGDQKLLDQGAPRFAWGAGPTKQMAQAAALASVSQWGGSLNYGHCECYQTAR